MPSINDTKITTTRYLALRLNIDGKIINGPFLVSVDNDGKVSWEQFTQETANTSYVSTVYITDNRITNLC